MNFANLASLFPNPAMNLAALAGWPSPSPADPMNPMNPPVAWYIPMYLPQLADQRSMASPIGSIPVNPQPTFPSAPGAPGTISPACFFMALPPSPQVPLPPGSTPPAASQSAPGVFIMVIPMHQPQSGPFFAPAPGPVGLPPVAQAVWNPPIGFPSPLGPISIGYMPQPVLGSRPMTNPASPMNPQPTPLGQPGPSFVPPMPTPIGYSSIAYFLPTLPTPPESTPVFGPPIPIYAMPPSPVPTPVPSSMMPPPPPAPPQVADGAGRGEAANLLSPQYTNGVIGFQSFGRPVRGSGAISTTSESGGRVRPVGNGPVAEPAPGSGPDPQGRDVPDISAPSGGPSPSRMPQQQSRPRKPLLNGHK